MKREFVWNSSKNELSCKERLTESELQLRYFEKEYLDYLNSFDQNDDIHSNYINSMSDYNRCLNSYIIEEKVFNKNSNEFDEEESDLILL